MANESRIAGWALGIALTVGVLTAGATEAQDAGQPAIGSATGKALGLDAARDHPLTWRLFGGLSEESLDVESSRAPRVGILRARPSGGA